MAAKYLQIANTIQEEIYQGVYNTTGYLPTEMEISEQYNVSRQTVRHALSVLVNNGLIERRQGSGSRVLKQKKTKKSKSLAVVTTYINDYIFPNIMRDIQLTFSKHGYAMLVYATQNRVDEERKILNELLQLHVDGLIIEGSKTALPSPNLDLYEKFKQNDIPVVFIHGCYPALKDYISITDDNYGGGYQLTNYLIKKGHSDIAGIFKNDDIQGLDRYHGYATAMHDLNGNFADSSVFWYNTAFRKEFNNPENPELKAFIRDVLSKCTALICYNDEVAYSLIKMLMSSGFSIPKDIAVVSFDNSQLSELSPVRITSLAHGTRRMGQKAAERLMALIEDRDTKSETVSWTLIEKDSC